MAHPSKFLGSAGKIFEKIGKFEHRRRGAPIAGSGRALPASGHTSPAAGPTAGASGRSSPEIIPAAGVLFGEKIFFKP